MTTPTLHDLLDGAADRALDGVPAPDPGAVLALARRDRLSRNRFRAASLVAAAVLVVLAGAALLAAGPGLVHRSAPASGPAGLPERWWTPPEWTPSVVGRPIEAASLLLDTTVVATGDAGVDGGLVRGFVVVSADGTAYRRIPAPDGAAVFLSPTGRHVAWLTGAPGRSSSVVVLELGTGRSRTTPLPAGTHPEAATVSWLPADAGVVVSSEIDGRQSATAVSRVDLDGRLTRLCGCGCGSGVVGAADPVGRVVVAGPAPQTPLTRLPGQPAPTDLTPAERERAVAAGVVLARVGPAGFAFAPDARRVAVVPGLATEDPADDTDLLVVGTDGRTRTTRLTGFTTLPGLAGLEVLAWTPRGVLLSGVPASGPPGLWTVDPDGAGTPTRVSTGDTDGPLGPARVVGVASEVVASGRAVAGAEPDRSHRSLAYWEHRYRVSSLHVALTGDPQRWIMLTCVVLGVLVLAGPPLHDRRRRLRKISAG